MTKSGMHKGHYWNIKSSKKWCEETNGANKITIDLDIFFP